MKTFTWRTGWINKYESPWSILEKFKYANSILNKDIYSILGIEDPYGNIRKNQIKSHRSLITLAAFDDKKLETIFGINIKAENIKNIIDATRIFSKNYSVETFIKKYLNFCPECIKSGYHSSWHQVSFFQNCFLHGKKLIDECPNCKKSIFYEFNIGDRSSGFKCKCGYSFIEENNIIYFTNWKCSPVLSATEQKWIEINTSSPEEICEIFQYNFYRDRRYQSNINERIFENIATSILELNAFDNSKLHKISMTDTPIKEVISIGIGKYDELLYASYKSILKSISRQIEKRDKTIRKNAMVLFKQQYRYTFGISQKAFFNVILSKLNIYPPSYAYLMWRRDLEGHDDHCKVLQKIVYRRSREDLSQYYNIVTKSELFQYFSAEFSRYIRANPRVNLSNLMCIFEHMMAHIFLQHYYNWFRFGNLYCNTENVILRERIPYIVPTFLIKISKSQNNKSATFYSINTF